MLCNRTIRGKMAEKEAWRLHMESTQVSQYKIGPFEYEEAVECIKKYALALTNLGLSKRFAISPTPIPVVGYENGRRTHYQVILTDRCPDEPKPEGLTAVQIEAAESAGYAKSKTTYYEAFGRRMTIGKWAEAVGVSRATLKARIDADLNMEEAITQIALKKAAFWG